MAGGEKNFMKYTMVLGILNASFSSSVNPFLKRYEFFCRVQKLYLKRRENSHEIRRVYHIKGHSLPLSLAYFIRKVKFSEAKPV